MITPHRLPTDEGADDLIVKTLNAISLDTYWAPLKKGSEILSTVNIQYLVKGFDVPHYISYFMENTATDEAPVYIVYIGSDEVMETEVRSKIHRLFKSHRSISMEFPQSYEEMLYIKAVDLANSFGSIAKVCTECKHLVWRCDGGLKNTFKKQFFDNRRSTMKIVS